MRAKFVIAITAILSGTVCSGSDLSGIWIINIAKSDFGGVAPGEHVFRIEQIGKRITLWEFTGDDSGMQVVRLNVLYPERSASLPVQNN